MKIQTGMGEPENFIGSNLGTLKVPMLFYHCLFID